MRWVLLIRCAAAILGGASIFAFSRRLHNFQKYVGFTFIFEGLMLLLGGSIMSAGASFYMPTYLLYLAMMLTIPFFYYFAVRYLLKENGVRGRDYWMLVVVVVYILSCATVIFNVPVADRKAFFVCIQGTGAAAGTVGARVLLAQDTLAYVLGILEYAFVLVYGVINVFRYRKLLSDFYSNLDGSRSAEVIVGVVFLRFALLVAFLFGGNLPEWMVAVRSALSVGFYAIAAVYVCRLEHTAEELSLLVKNRERAVDQKLPAADEIISSRLGKMIEDKFYINPDVTLMDVSAEIQVNTKYISEYLKYHYNETFLLFVNRLRVEASKALLSEGRMSVEDIAEQCGYTSISTYYRNFTKICGINPSEFREKARKSTDEKVQQL